MQDTGTVNVLETAQELVKEVFVVLFGETELPGHWLAEKRLRGHLLRVFLGLLCLCCLLWWLLRCHRSHHARYLFA